MWLVVVILLLKRQRDLVMKLERNRKAMRLVRHRTVKLERDLVMTTSCIDVY
jgi:hypothetical protein